MKSFIKNLKVSTTIIILSIISIVFSLIIGIYGIISTGRINDNVSTMYDHRLIPIVNISKMRENFVLIRLNCANADLNFDERYMKLIDESDREILKDLNEYKYYCDKEESKFLKIFEDNYKGYLDIAKKSVMSSKSGNPLTKEEADKITEMGSEIEKSLNDLQNYDIKLAEKSKLESNKIFITNRNILISIIVFCIIIFAILSSITFRNFNGFLKEIDSILKQMSLGNLQLEIKKQGENEFEEMKKYIQDTINNFGKIIRDLKSRTNSVDYSSEHLSTISEEMAYSSNNISTAINDVAKGTCDQAGNLVDINNILNNFGNNIKKVVNGLSEVNDISNNVATTADESSKEMKNLEQSFEYVGQSYKKFVQKIDSLGKNINKIDEITVLINNVAEQTNLLSLNAAIEAARAGKSGKGFAVVAEEIRKLAEQSKQSSNNISILISEISKETKNIVDDAESINNKLQESSQVIKSSLDSFGNIIISIGEVVPKVNALNKSAIAINEEKNNIFQKIEGASSIAEEISAYSEEIAASSNQMDSSSREVEKVANELRGFTNELLEEINLFKI
ncbi:methyl-accepting chemotaxis protein [Clostridium lundense]|uniref:methyl-accepting chemotaxis protein n=1 Tax=Clostridium lundense TaxID=319475 RepID=UPI00048202BF|nr:methyl-accepting chemotaxis protein [Clostridium lundense]